MENPLYPKFECSRCSTYIHEPVYVCENGHLACEKCKKVFCQICRHLFVDRSEAVRRGEVKLDSYSSASGSRARVGNPYQPDDGSTEFGKRFVLPKKGLCRFHGYVGDREYTFNWKINPQETIIEVNVTPTETVKENWFIVEFCLPSDENKKMKKEWAVSHCLHVNYKEIEAFYENDSIVCKIYIQEIPYGTVVKPFEDKVRDAFVSVFSPKRNNPREPV